jgi:hypothetical protein
MSSAAVSYVNKIPTIVERVASDVRDHMDTIPSGGVTGEEEYAMWGREFVKKLVRNNIFVFNVFISEIFVSSR